MCQMPSIDQLININYDYLTNQPSSNPLKTISAKKDRHRFVE